jgi:hypothetical protein
MATDGRVYCARSRLEYSLPLMTSSSSARRSLRSRLDDASETKMRSSSLSTHAAGRAPRPPSSSEPASGAASSGAAVGSVPMKNSFFPVPLATCTLVSADKKKKDPYVVVRNIL